MCMATGNRSERTGYKDSECLGFLQASASLHCLTSRLFVRCRGRNLALHGLSNARQDVFERHILQHATRL